MKNIALAESSPLFETLKTQLAERNVLFDSLPAEKQEWIARLVRFSPHLTTICIAKTDLLAELLLDEAVNESLTVEQLQARLHAKVEQGEDAEIALRRFHRQQIIRIALRDLCEIVDIKQVTEDLSNLADVLCEAAYRLFWEQLTGVYGVPFSRDVDQSANMAVIAMGKHGGQELNFSSDIDLMFVYDYDGETEGSPDGSITNQRFFTLLAQKMCEFLTKTTAEGFLYRVDTRLRPDGPNGPIASSLTMIEDYYHFYGQNWERQALLKARAVAGAPAVGEKFMRIIHPFTYRKYVDEIEIAEVLRSIDGMRNKSLAKLGSEEVRSIDFKNGYGGIRDIEFFTQAVQILYGGQYPEIKQAGTLLALLRMHESGLLHSKEFGFLSIAYRFLREVEHHLQMVGEQQVYQLPSSDEEMQRLSDSLGYPSKEAFFHQYQKTTKQVREIYRGVFQRDEWEDETEILSESDSYSETIGALLREHGFQDPRSAFNFIQSLGKSPEIHLQPKTSRLFKAILPRLLKCVKQSPDSDMALRNFEKLVATFRARTAIYETLCDQPQFLDLLVSVVSCSSFLTSQVLRDPSLMETIGRDLTFKETVTISSLKTHLRLMRASHKSGDFRDQLLRVQNAAMLRSGIRFILGLSTVRQVGKELACLADFVLQQCMKPCHAMMAERYPTFTEAYADEIGIIGMGKLGGEEFNVASDCDLIFLYEGNRKTAEVTSAEYYVRWASKYVDYVQKKSPLGFLYEVDARLRPHGGNSPLASSLASFDEYFCKHAQLWEKMALSRARFICGSDGIRQALTEFKERLLFSRALTGDEIRDILAMREKIESAKKHETLKAGPGGIIDVEFITQALVLHYGMRYPALRVTSTLDALRVAQEEGLLPESHARQLETSYLFLREVENRLRIVNNASLDAIPTEEKDLEKLIRRYALRLDTAKLTHEEFLGTISLHTCKVREVFTRFFDDVLKPL
jgi:[glutamine synthetase] adenylyltransferase / [glutamine synthetase]-adenylyl-L-tyrosine phosphorylase